jgi:cytochrome d ubiquinol oxidase subunit I
VHYPWWYVPHLTAPMLIAAVATFHVLVAHYAVGGGLFLAVEVRHAHRAGNRAYLAYLRRHAQFFVLVTLVLGAASGVGIWWTIGLASPLATEMLIRLFVFAWGIEYVFFLMEIVSAFLFYTLWDRLQPRTHVLFVSIYAASAWLSLVVITGITSFMLHAGTWPERGTLTSAFFNPQFLPQVVMRTGGALLLASMYVYFHASVFARDPVLLRLVAVRSARPALLGAAAILAGGLAWLWGLPEHSRALLVEAPALNILTALLFLLTVIVFVVFLVGPVRDPAWLGPGFGALFLLVGIGAVALGEFVREAVRKPYVVDRTVLGSQVMVRDLPALQRRGLLESGPWTRAWLAARYPAVVRGDGVDEAALLRLPNVAQEEVGRVVFMHQCNDCHAMALGLSALAPSIRPWPDERLRELARAPESFKLAMPPFAGTPEEAELLARWLIALRGGPPETLVLERGER